VPNSSTRGGRGTARPRLRLCEFTRLALDEQAMSKEVLGSLFHSATVRARRARPDARGHRSQSAPRCVLRRVLHFKGLVRSANRASMRPPCCFRSTSASSLASSIASSPTDWRSQSKSFFVHWFSPRMPRASSAVCTGARCRPDGSLKRRSEPPQVFLVNIRSGSSRSFRSE